MPFKKIKSWNLKLILNYLPLFFKDQKQSIFKSILYNSVSNSVLKKKKNQTPITFMQTKSICNKILSQTAIFFGFRRNI